MRLTISRGLIDEMIAAAAASPDAEICGLLLGKGRDVSAIIPCANVAARPADSFEIDPRALIQAHRAAREGGAAILGHYHSHPRGPAEPSRRDAEAADPGSIWIIVGQGGHGCWLSMRAPDGGVCFEPVAIVATGNS